ncbi:hypothetical protein [Protofrankia coriariae]|uniref:Uncharacterized protein n=1 Tax=Protofrankia coriariae TaxID=1562887 RepID=A0ABR5F1R8_9ACTN|nr:hypothetical protein [Protofrankia coriariae]KLL10660.1 hypothetical protein FrCorBMG51_16980 [Protofrankia coriariae]
MAGLREHLGADILRSAVLLPFFRTGPLAWNGIIVFRLAAFVFIAQFIVKSTRRAAHIHSSPSKTTAMKTTIDVGTAPGVECHAFSGRPAARSPMIVPSGRIGQVHHLTEREPRPSGRDSSSSTAR